MSRKIFYLLPFFFSLLFPSASKAAILKITKEKKVILNILSFQNDSLFFQDKEMEVKKVSSFGKEVDKVSLRKEGERFYLVMGGDGAQMDVSSVKDELIEIEERDNTKKITIALDRGYFVINHDGVVATTDFPIEIDPINNKFYLSSESGLINLNILPKDALSLALRSRFLDRSIPEGLKILEREPGQITYEIDGERVLNLFYFFSYKVPVSVYISAVTGKIIYVNQPLWLRLLGSFI